MQKSDDLQVHKQVTSYKHTKNSFNLMKRAINQSHKLNVNLSTVYGFYF